MAKEYCPICGNYIGTTENVIRSYLEHRCPEKTLLAIDAARTREKNDSEAFHNIMEPPFGEKLEDAFQMIDPDRDEHELEKTEIRLEEEIFLLELKH